MNEKLGSEGFVAFPVVKEEITQLSTTSELWNKRSNVQERGQIASMARKGFGELYSWPEAETDPASRIFTHMEHSCHPEDQVTV